MNPATPVSLDPPSAPGDEPWPELDPDAIGHTEYKPYSLREAFQRIANLGNRQAAAPSSSAPEQVERAADAFLVAWARACEPDDAEFAYTIAAWRACEAIPGIPFDTPEDFLTAIAALLDAVSVPEPMPPEQAEAARRLSFWLGCLDQRIKERDNDEQVEVEGRDLHNLSHAAHALLDAVSGPPETPCQSCGGVGWFNTSRLAQGKLRPKPCEACNLGGRKGLAVDASVFGPPESNERQADLEAEVKRLRRGIAHEPHDYTIEVCLCCGAQLDRSGNGRCPVDRKHWSYGGMVVRVLARPDREQDRHFRPGRVPAAAQVGENDEGEPS